MLGLRRSVVTLVAATVVGSLLSGCGTRAEQPNPQAKSTSSRHGRHVQVRPGGPVETVAGDAPPGCRFRTVAQLVATSDVVVVGQVISAGIGRLATGEPAESHGDRWRRLTVQVSQIVYGQPASRPVVVLQSGYMHTAWIPGEEKAWVPYELGPQPWLHAGDRVVAFLQRAHREPERYTMLGPGEWILNEGTVTTPAVEPVARVVDGRRWARVQSLLTRAAEKATNGTVHAVHPRDSKVRC